MLTKAVLLILAQLPLMEPLPSAGATPVEVHAGV
jgi:hypothetical protein